MPLIKVFKCAHSGKYLPNDYVEQWGIKYGHGLGPKPVSECLDTQYGMAPQFQNIVYNEAKDKMMFPFTHSCAPIEIAWVEEEEFNNPENRLITHHEDPDFSKRKALLRKIQFKKDKVKGWAGTFGVPAPVIDPVV